MVEASLAAAEDAALSLSSSSLRIQPPAVAIRCSLADGADTSQLQDVTRAPAATGTAGDGLGAVPPGKETAGNVAVPMPAVGSEGMTTPSALANLCDDAQEPATSISGRRSLDHGLIPLPMLRCNGTHATFSLPPPAKTGSWRPGEAAAGWPCAAGTAQRQAVNAVQTRDPLHRAPMEPGGPMPAELQAPALGAASVDAQVSSADGEPLAADEGDAGLLACADGLSAEHAMATVGSLLSEDDSALEDGGEEHGGAAAGDERAADGHPPCGVGGAGQSDGAGITEQRLVPGERSLQELGAMLLFEKTLSGADTKRAVLIPKVRAIRPGPKPLVPPSNDNKCAA